MFGLSDGITLWGGS